MNDTNETTEPNDIAEPEPAFYAKGTKEYFDERERALAKRLEDAREREAKVKAEHATELQPVHSTFEALGAKVNIIHDEITAAKLGVRVARADIESKHKLIESLLSEIETMEASVQRVETNLIPGLENKKVELQTKIEAGRASCTEIDKKWRRKLHEAEGEVRKLSLRLTRVQLRRPK